MIRALAHQDDGTPMVLLGLDDENLDRMRTDQPIRVNLSELVPGQHTELPDITVVIFHATEAAADALAKAVQT